MIYIAYVNNPLKLLSKIIQVDLFRNYLEETPNLANVQKRFFHHCISKYQQKNVFAHYVKQLYV